MFLSTLGINHQWVETTYKKLIDGDGTIKPDLRGKFTRPVAAITTEIFSNVKCHIEKFPQIESHYSRERSSKNYIAGEGLNIYKMYRLYLEDCAQLVIANKATERQYRDIFVKEYNIAFY